MSDKKVNINNKKKIMKDLNNKTILSAVATVLVAGTAFFTSCEKDVTSNLEVGELKVSEVENPFDFIGEKHNEILHYMGMEMKDTLDYYAQKGVVTDEDRENVFSYILATMPDVISKNSILNTSEQEINGFMETYIDFLKEDQFESLFINNPDFQIIKTIMNEVSSIPSAKQQAEIVRAKQLEILSSANKWADTCVVVFLNVYEHSIVYWEDALINTSSPWYKFFQSIDNSKQISSKALPSWKEACAYIKKGFDKACDWIHEVFSGYTWRNIAEADAIGAGYGALSIGLMSGWNGSAMLSGAIITGPASSIINPLYM